MSAPPDPLLSTVLDLGEASVIHAARCLNITRVLMDERKGRNIARNIYGLTVMGTARILIDAHKAGFIQDIGRAFARMKEAGYWIHDNIIEAALREVRSE